MEKGLDRDRLETKDQLEDSCDNPIQKWLLTWTCIKAVESNTSPSLEAHTNKALNNLLSK